MFDYYLKAYTTPTVNTTHRILLFVTREREPVPWGHIKDLQNIIWDLYLLHWDTEQQLLFIHSSNNDSLHEELAQAVAGDEVEIIRGETVFRSLHGINRMILMNLGLNHSLSRAVRFTMYVGSDIRQGLAEAHLVNKIKSNLFARGYEQGDKASVGCSYKGRIWSYKIANGIAEWLEWCYRIGTKLLDHTIAVRDILEHVIIPDTIQQRPALAPLTIEWSEAFLQRSEDIIQLDIAGERHPFFDVGLELVQHERHGPLRFRLFTETASVEYEVRFRQNSVEYVATGEGEVDIVISRKRKSLSEWFELEPPIIRFEDGAFLIYNLLYKVPSSDRTPYNRERIEAWDWTGTDLRKESQTVAKRSDSIQYRVIQELLAAHHDPHYEIVFDDDASHEAADVVAIKIVGERLVVHLFHCKFSTEGAPGARVEDLHAVCGQAQRSVYWKGDVRRLIDHLRHREASRERQHRVSRFERGNLNRLAEMARQVPFLIPEFKIFIVQPGLSKSRIETGQLDLLAVTELYLQETYAVEFGVIASP